MYIAGKNEKEEQDIMDISNNNPLIKMNKTQLVNWLNNNITDDKTRLAFQSILDALILLWKDKQK